MIDLLDLLLIEPIRQALLLVLEISFELTQNYGIALVLLSVFFNIALAPAYHYAEILQNRERQTQQKMKRKLDEFKRAFKGQERYWMIKTLYRQNNYHPVYALRGIVALAIQIPFFIATFGLLSVYEPLNGAQFGIFSDLGHPDQLVANVNVLPIMMTALNMVSVYIYSRNGNRTEFWQGMGISLIFLVFLYDSPAGLVLYWTINNLISACKSTFYTTKFKKLSRKRNSE